MIRIIIACVGIVLSLFSIGLAVWSLIRLRKWDRENEAYIQARNARYEELKRSCDAMSEHLRNAEEKMTRVQTTLGQARHSLEQCYHSGDGTDDTDDKTDV